MKKVLIIIIAVVLSLTGLAWFTSLSEGGGTGTGASSSAGSSEDQSSSSVEEEIDTGKTVKTDEGYVFSCISFTYDGSNAQVDLTSGSFTSTVEVSKVRVRLVEIGSTNASYQVVQKQQAEKIVYEYTTDTVLGLGNAAFQSDSAQMVQVYVTVGETEYMIDEQTVDVVGLNW
ncbi:MAG: hypothetical protein IJX88_05285 [Clostridia bacterium]|nr:hypothetical protein [Clostridia bacterium]